MLADVDDLELVQREFGLEEGSFLLTLRSDLHWDRAAFSRLEQALRRVSAQLEPQRQLDRWLVKGFWLLTEFVPGHTSHPDFPRPEPPEYYEAALERIRDLHYWFAMGESIYLPGHEWPDLAAEHWAFCNEFGGTGLHDVSGITASLMSSPIWTFWQD
jgi:hypothetical protein